jgi:hypothetical protein
VVALDKLAGPGSEGVFDGTGNVPTVPALALPASRWGQALSSVYVQLWLDRYLKHERNLASLLGDRFRYLEPRGHGVWRPVTLDRDNVLGFYYCSAYAVRSASGVRQDEDVTGVGC